MRQNIRKKAWTAILISCFFLLGCGGQITAPSQINSQQEIVQDEPLHIFKKANTDTEEEKALTSNSSDAQNNSEHDISPSSSLPSPSVSGALQVSGTQLTDSSGNPVQLKGISTHGLAWFPEYVNEDCFAELRTDWNANVIRLAMYTAESGGYCTDGDPSRLKELIRKGVQYASDQDMYVIIDWHILSDSNPNIYLEEAQAFFQEVSEEFSQETHVLYEICNEPNGQTSWNDIKNYALNVIPVIRSNDPDAVIIVGTPNWSQWVDQAAEDPITEYDNIMYALHFYAATHKEDLRSKMEAAVSSGLPVFVSEYGICDANGNGAIDPEEANQWIAALDQYQISYIAWNLSNKNESSAVLQPSCDKTCSFTKEDLSNSGQWLYQMLNHQKDVEPDNHNSTPGVSSSTDTFSDPPEHKITETANFSESSVEVTAKLAGSWESDGIPYYQYILTLKNISEQPLSHWEIDLSFTGTPTLSDSWNGVYTLQDHTLHIASLDYNGSISPGNSISDIGFIVMGAELEMEP